MAQKKMYSEEFKRDAIRLQETSGKSIGTIENELGLSHNLLRQWKKRYQVNEETDELERSEVEQLKAELRQAKRELEIMRQERDILKHIMRSQVQATCFINLRVFARPETSNSKMGAWHP